MRRFGLSHAALIRQAEERWQARPEPLEGVLGPVVIGFQLGLGALSDAVELEAFLLAPRPELAWLMGEMGTQLHLRPEPWEYPWRLTGETQVVWVTYPLLVGFLKALWRTTRDHNGVVEEWNWDEP